MARIGTGPMGRFAEGSVARILYLATRGVIHSHRAHAAIDGGWLAI
jgi:hypothetical protein